MVDVDWHPAPGADGYHVYKVDGSSTTLLHTEDDPTVTTWRGTVEEITRFRVTAYEQDGATTVALSSADDSGVANLPSITTPTVLQGRVGTELNVSWPPARQTSISGASSTRRYRIQWKPEGGSFGQPVTVSGTTRRIEGLEPNTRYTVRVSPEYNYPSIGIRLFGVPAEAEMTTSGFGLSLRPRPGSPPGLSADWDAVPGATRYLVAWRPEGPGDGRYTTADLASDQTSLDIPPPESAALQPGTRYEVSVTPFIGAASLRHTSHSATTFKAFDWMHVSGVAADDDALDVDWSPVTGAHSYLVQWRLAGDTDFNDGHVVTHPASPGAKVNYRITGLTTSDTAKPYLVRVTLRFPGTGGSTEPVANNYHEDHGVPLSHQSPALSVRTSSTAGKPARSLYLNWTDEPLAVGYDVQWGKVDATKPDPAALRAPDRHGHVISDLDAATEYRARLAVVYLSGVQGTHYRGPFAEQTATTGQAPPARPTLGNIAVAAVSTDHGALDVSWDAVTGARDYVVQWKTGRESYSTDTRSGVSELGATTYRIEGLSRSTAYDVRVTVRFRLGSEIENGNSSEASGTTAAQSTFGELSLVPGGGATPHLTASWDKLGGATGYLVQWKSGEQTFSTTERTHTASAATTSYVIDNLAAGTTYDVKVTSQKPTTALQDSVEASASTYAQLEWVTYDTCDVGGALIRNVYQAWSRVAGAHSYLIESVDGAQTTSAVVLAGTHERHIRGSLVLTPAGTIRVTVRFALDDGTLVDGNTIEATQGVTLERVARTVTVTPPPSELDALTVTWNADNRWDGRYRIQWRTDEGWFNVPVFVEARRIDGSFPTSYKITGLTPGTRYTVRLVRERVVTDGVGTGCALERTVSTTALPALDAISVDPVSGDTSKLNVSWTDVAGNKDYVLQWKSGAQEYSESERHEVLGADDSSYEITGLTAGATYTVRLMPRYTISGVATDGDAVEAAGTVLPVLGAIEVDQVSGDTSKLDVTWTDVAGNTGYVVQWKSGAEEYSDTLRRAELGADASSYEISGLTAGTRHTVRVTARHTIGGAEADGDASEADGTTLPALGAITVDQVSGDTSKLDVSWTDVSGNTGYVVQWKTSGEEYSETLRRDTVGANATSYEITGLTAGATYTVRVTARHTIGGAEADGDASEADGTTLPALAAITVDQVSGETSKLDVSWTDVSGNTGYVVQWKTSGQEYSETLRRDTVGANATSYEITGLTAGTAYTVQVTARHMIGGVEADGDASEASGTTLPALGAITVEKVSGDTAKLSVKWTDVSGNTGYVVQWKSASEEYSDSARRAELGADAVSHEITNLTAGTTYTVRVTARHTIGGTEVDGDSSEASGTTLAGALVSNLAETATTGHDVGTSQIAQAFTTGSNASGYTVTRVDLDLEVGASVSRGARLRVEVMFENSGEPFGTFAVFTSPASLATGTNAFTHPGLLLQPDTTYLVRVEGIGATGISVGRTASDSQTGAAGWSIGDNAILPASFGRWSPNTNAVKVRISGIVEADVEPSFGDATVADQSYTEGTAVDVTLPEATGGNGSLTYSLTGELPVGLSFTAATRKITGTPTFPLAETTYTYKATDADDDEATLTFTIAVAEDAQNRLVSNLSVSSFVATAADITNNLGFQHRYDVAQGFITGSHSGGYLLTGVGLAVKRFAVGDPGLTVSIHSNASGSPDASLGTLTAPASIIDGVNEYTHAGIQLSPSTTYFVVVDSPGTKTVDLYRTRSAVQQGAAGWSVLDTSARRPVSGALDAWSPDGNMQLIRIRGEAVSPLQTTVSAVAGDATKLDVSWQTVQDADRYLVQHKTGPAEFSTGTTTTETSMQLADLVAGTTYTVKVTAQDTGANPVADLTSDEAEGTTHLELTGLAVAPVAGNHTSLTATWDAVTGATGYVVQWKLASESAYPDANEATPTDANYTITSLRPSTEYDVKVTARVTVNSVTVDGDSAEASGTTAAEATLEGLTLVVTGGDTITASWDAVNGATSYTVLWRLDSASAFPTANRRDPTGTSQQITGLNADTAYFVEVQAVLPSVGAEHAPPGPLAQAVAYTSSITGSLTVAPVQHYSSRLKVDWVTTGVTASGVLVEWKSGDQSYSRAERSVELDSFNAGTVTLEGLDPGTLHDIRVTALHTVRGSKVRGGTVSGNGTTTAGMPGFTVAPAPGDATALLVSWDYDQFASQIEVQWKSGDEDFRHGIPRYVALPQSLGAPDTSYKITGLTTGTEYDVKVMVSQPETPGSEHLIASVRVGEGSGTPRALVTSLAAAPVSGNTKALDVSWDAVIGAAGFRVQWKLATESDYSTVGNIQNTAAGASSYQVGSLVPDTDYTVKVTSLVGDPAEDDDSDEVDATTLDEMGDVTVEPVPESTSELDVSWPDINGETGYLVEWKLDTDTDYSTMGNSHTTAADATNYRITGLDAGTAYDVRVTAKVTISGQPDDGDSAEGAGTTLAELAGLSVLAVSGDTTRLAVSWNAYPEADKYLVQRKTVSGSFDDGVETAFTTRRLSGLTADTTYTVKVTAIDTGTGTDVTLISGEADGTTLDEMGDVTVEAVSGDTTKLDVSWPAINGETGFLVQWKTASEIYSTAERFAEPDADATSYQITGLNVGAAYDVKVTAKVSIGGVEMDGDSAEGSGTTASGLAGLSVAAVSGDPSKLDVSWDAYTGADKYLVQHKTGSGEFDTGVEVTTTSRQLTGLTADTPYTVKVTAIDDPDVELASGEANGTTLDAMGDVTVEAVPGDTTKLDVSWPAIDGETGFLVQWKTGDETYSTTERNAERDTDATSYQITGLTAGTDYDVKVTAKVSIGGVEVDGDSAEGEGTTLADLAGLSVEAVSGDPNKLDVSWDTYTGAEKYLVQHKTGPDDFDDGVEVTTTTSRRLTGLTADTTYTVKVTAIDTGTGTDVPLISAEADGTTLDEMGTVTVNPVSNDSSELVVSWPDVNGEVGYRVQWKLTTDTGYSTTGNSHTNPADATGYRISGLQGGTAYDVRVTARVMIGGVEVDGDSAAGQGTTASDPVSGLSVSSVESDPTALEVSWSLSTENGVTYLVQWKGSGESYSTSERSYSADAAEDGYDIVGLAPATAYDVRVTQQGGVSDGTALEESGARTAAWRLDLEVGEGPREVEADWDLYPGANRYVVQYKSGTQSYSTSERHGETGRLGATIGGLTGGVTYMVQVTAVAVTYDDQGDEESRSVLHSVEGSVLRTVDLALRATPVSEKATALSAVWLKPATDPAGYVLQWRVKEADGQPASQFADADKVTFAVSDTTEIYRSVGSLSSYELTGLDANTAYVLRLSSFTAAGSAAAPDGASDEAEASTVFAVASVAAAAPAGVAGALDVSWTVPAVLALTPVGWAVFWKSGSESYSNAERNAAVADATARSYRIEGLEDATAYDVRVYPVLPAVSENFYGVHAEGRGTTSDLATGVAGLTVSAVTGDTTKLDVSWSAYTGAEKYRVQWKSGVESFSTTTRSVEVTTTSRRLTGLTADTTYTVKVTAVDTDPTPDADLVSAEADGATLDEMGAVTVQAVTGDSSRLDVSWPAINGETGFLVQWKTGSETYSTTERSAAPAADATSYQITGLSAGTVYDVKVTAKVTIGAATTDGDSAVGQGTTTAALAGLSVSAVTGDTTRLDVSWNAYSGAEKYRVQWKSGVESFSTITRSAVVTTTSRQLTNLTAGTAYVVKVTAIDTDTGTDVDLISGEASGTTTAALSVLAVTGDTSKLDVSWDAYSGAEKYRLQWKSGVETFSTTTRSLTVTTTSRQLTSLSADTAYTVRLTPIDTDTGVDVDLPSVEASGKTLDEMGAVTVQAVTGDSSRLDVSWPAINGETGFLVQWKTGSETYSTTERNAAPAADATSYQITGLSAGTAYDVKVTAKVTIGGATVDGDSATGQGATTNEFVKFIYEGIGDQALEQGRAMTPLELPAAYGGDGTYTYTLTPELPAGLLLGSLSGTPTAVFANTEFTYTVTDGGSLTDTFTFDISVGAAQDDGVTVTPATLVEVEQDPSPATATYAVTLRSDPGAAVTVTPASGDRGTATVSTARTDNTLVFTSANWNTPQNVTVTLIDDNIVNRGGFRFTQITHEVSGYGTVTSGPPVSLWLQDDDGPNVVADARFIDVDEGGTATYNVWLTAAPDATVTVTPASSADTNVTVSGALQFTTSNWNTPQTVTLTGEDNSIHDTATRSSVITHTVSGGGYGSAIAPTLRATVIDDEEPDLTLALSTTTLGVDENGGTASYTVVLGSRPTGTVTVSVTSSNTGAATVSASSLSFTTANWSTPQTVTVTGVNDDVDNPGDQRSATIRHSASGGGYGSVSIGSVRVTVRDDDAARDLSATASVTVSPASVSVDEDGGTAVYTVVLTVQPSGTVTVSFSSSDRTAARVSVSSLYFRTGDWSVPRSVTVTGVNDDVDNPGDQRSATIRHSASGGGYSRVSIDPVTVTVRDDDTDVAPGTGDGDDGDGDDGDGDDGDGDDGDGDDGDGDDGDGDDGGQPTVPASGVTISDSGLIMWRHTATSRWDSYWVTWTASYRQVELVAEQRGSSDRRGSTRRRASTPRLENLGDQSWDYFGINDSESVSVRSRSAHCDHADGYCRLQIDDFDDYLHYFTDIETWLDDGNYGRTADCCVRSRYTPPDRAPRPADPPAQAAISAAGTITWRHAPGYGGSYQIDWAESDRRLDAFHQRRDYGAGVTRLGDWEVRAADACDANGYCRVQLGEYDPIQQHILGDFDSTKHYIIQVNTSEREDLYWDGWFRAPVEARYDP